MPFYCQGLGRRPFCDGLCNLRSGLSLRFHYHSSQRFQLFNCGAKGVTALRCKNQFIVAANSHLSLSLWVARLAVISARGPAGLVRDSVYCGLSQEDEFRFVVYVRKLIDSELLMFMFLAFFNLVCFSCSPLFSGLS